MAAWDAQYRRHAELAPAGMARDRVRHWQLLGLARGAYRHRRCTGSTVLLTHIRPLHMSPAAKAVLWVRKGNRRDGKQQGCHGAHRWHMCAGQRSVSNKPAL
jgi:hypothetical protein